MATSKGLRQRQVLDEELEEALGGGIEDVVILPSDRKKQERDGEVAQQEKKSKFQDALEKYKPRPENAVPSRKKDQRLAEEVKKHLREEKRVRKLAEKQQDETIKRQKRLEIFERLKKTQLSREDRESLKTSTDLTKQISTAEREVGKVGERQRRKETGGKKRSAGLDVVAGGKVIVSKYVVSSSSSSEGEDDEVEAEDNVAQSNSEAFEEDEDEEGEEYGLVIPPTPTPPPVSYSNNIVALKMSNKQPVGETNRPRKNSLVSASDVPSSSAAAPDSIEPLLIVRPERPQAMIDSRSKLPVYAMEQEIVEAVKSSSVVFICGETGSGKTTQIPQMLLEAGFGCEGSKLHPGQICVAQPRRVAAISVADRVGQELGCPLMQNISKNPSRGNRQGLFAQDLRGCVGYQIRHDSDTVSSDCTRIKFCTDGILLRECKEDFLLRQYSCIVMDEIHERGLNTDLLLGILSRIVPLRTQLYREGKPGITPLKLVIMSATMDLDDFKSLSFPSNSPVIRIETRQHSVIPHFARRTEQIEYLQATLKKCCQVHEKLPSGGVLVFLPGQREIEWFCRQLKDKYNNDDDNVRPSSISKKQAPLKKPSVEVKSNNDEPPPTSETQELELVALGSDQEEEEDGNEEDGEKRKLEQPNAVTTAIVQPKIIPSDANAETNFELSDDEEDVEDDDDRNGKAGKKKTKSKKQQKEKSSSSSSSLIRKVRVVPLYSRLSSAKQKLAFQPPEDEEQCRMIVVATNVAETSLTIPGIRYVVDSGREKRRTYDQQTGTSGFRVGWISQASASQRLGRAGRLGPGHCYRLYSSAMYNDMFMQKSEPEILTVPIDDLVLYMKTLGIDRIQDFPFPTALDPQAIASAISRLKHLGCLDSSNDRATPLGQLCSKLPVPVRIAKSLVVALEEPRFDKLLSHVIALCALLSLASPFDSQNVASNVFAGDGTSDALALLRAAGAFSHDQSERFCVKHGLNHKTMREFVQLYEQLVRIVNNSIDRHDRLHPKLLPMRPLGRDSENLLRQSIVSGLLDRIARKMEPARARAFMRSTEGIFPPRHLKDWPYDASDPALGAAVFLHSHSVLIPRITNVEEEDMDHTNLPEFVAFTSVNEFGKMEGCTAVESVWLRSLSSGTGQCIDHLSETPEPFYDSKTDSVQIHVKPLYGNRAWVLPIEKIQANTLQQLHLKAACPAFARAMMEGKVCGRFVADEQNCVAPFAHLTRAPLQARVVQFTNRLIKAQIVSRAQLIRKWKEDPDFLKREICEWLKPDERNKFEEQWPTKIKQILQTYIV